MSQNSSSIGYVFRCTDRTMRECFSRMLFGEKDYQNYQEMVFQVKPGDYLFLHNNTTLQLYGVFRAVTTGQRNIMPEAWGGGFPLQVKVEWAPKFEKPLPREITEEVMSFWGKTKRHPHEYLHGLQIPALIRLFETYAPISQEEFDFRLRHKRIYPALDGHWVRSFAECMIDDWLFKHRIPHGYEARLPMMKDRFCDFFIPYGEERVYIEYWGMEDNAKYRENMQEKIALYQQHNLPLIELRRTDLDHLEEIMPGKLREFLLNHKFL